MDTRKLGRHGLEVSAIGLGCMGMTYAYDTAAARDQTEAVATLHEALDRGVSFLDTAEVYGPWANESLLGSALRGRRDRAVIATKSAFESEPMAQPPDWTARRPTYVPRAMLRCSGWAST